MHLHVLGYIDAKFDVQYILLLVDMTVQPCESGLIMVYLCTPETWAPNVVGCLLRKLICLSTDVLTWIHCPGILAIHLKNSLSFYLYWRRYGASTTGESTKSCVFQYNWKKATEWRWIILAACLLHKTAGLPNYFLQWIYFTYSCIPHGKV